MRDIDVSTYPVDLATAVRSRWAACDQPLEALPPEPSLVALLDQMYQASLLREEGAPVRCRIVVAPPDAFAQDLVEADGDRHVVRFAPSCAFTAHDLRKLAAAAERSRALLGVDVRGECPVIWGMVATGTHWVNRIGAVRVDEAGLPPHLVIQILNPGHLVVASGYARVLESAGGRLLTEGFDPFRSTWLPERFSPIRSSLLAELLPVGRGAVTARICDMFLRDVAQSIFRRVLNLVRTSGHGGLLVFLPAGPRGDMLADQWFRFRARFAPDPSTQRFQRLLVRLMQRVLEIGSDRGLSVCTWDDYRKMHDPELAELDDALMGFGHSLADMMAVDGALVLDLGFRLIGFGGEILGDSHVNRIDRALDLEAEQTVAEAADASGTRHRAAYRLVNGVPDAIAVVVSQDGDIRFVAHHAGMLSYWPYLP